MAVDAQVVIDPRYPAPGYAVVGPTQLMPVGMITAVHLYQWGTVTTPTLTGNQATDVSVTFPASFSGQPPFYCGAISAADAATQAAMPVTIHFKSATTTGCVYTIWPARQGRVTFLWFAVGPAENIPSP